MSPIYDFPEVEPTEEEDEEPGVGTVVFIVVVIGSVCVSVFFVAWALLYILESVG